MILSPLQIIVLIKAIESKMGKFEMQKFLCLIVNLQVLGVECEKRGQRLYVFEYFIFIQNVKISSFTFFQQRFTHFCICFINVDSCRGQRREVGNKLEVGINCLLYYWSCEEKSSLLEEQEVLLTTKITLWLEFGFKKKKEQRTQ